MTLKLFRNNLGLRIGREITTILDYTDFNPCAAAYQPKKLPVSENEFIRNYLLPRSTQTWPFLSTPNAMMNGYPFGIFEPPSSAFNKKQGIEITSRKSHNTHIREAKRLQLQQTSVDSCSGCTVQHNGFDATINMR